VTTKIVKVRLPLREVKKRFLDLPAILAGRLPDPRGIRRYFFSLVARFLYRLIHTAFDAKSRGGTDSLGYSWRSLKPSTLRRRKSPSILERFPHSAQLYILRVSGALYDSFAPGEITGGNYVPKSGQLFDITHDGLALGSTLRHAKHAFKKRPLWPPKIKGWIKDATDYALNKVLNRMADEMAQER
jgi:hypothetical protein